MTFILVAIVGYLLGSVPFGLLIGKYWLGIDVRSQGSGNIGSTNVMRVGGKFPGILTFVLDMGKGVVAMTIARAWLVDDTGQMLVVQASLVAIATIGGHVFPIFLQFKGGKGIATLFGVLAVLHFPIGLTTGLVWVGVFAAKRISSLSALTALGVLPFLFLIIPPILGESISVLQFFLFCGLSGLLIYRHRENIVRLLHGEEKQLKPSQSANSDA